MCSPDVLAPSTLSSYKMPLGGPELPSFVMDSLGPRRSHAPNSSMRLTSRDIAILELVSRCRALRADHIQIALFTPGGASRTQRRLTLLVRNHYLDRLPRRSVNEQAVYLLTRRSVQGNRIIRATQGDAVFRRHMTRLGSLPHLLGINDVRVRVERACRELGWELRQWRSAEDLVKRMPSTVLVPDAYFTIGQSHGQTVSFFLELERVPKTIQVVRGKLSRYADLIRRSLGQPDRSLCVLFVFDDTIPEGLSHRAEAANQEATRIGATFARFIALSRLTTLASADCLAKPVWLAPGHGTPLALSGVPGA